MIFNINEAWHLSIAVLCDARYRKITDRILHPACVVAWAPVNFVLVQRPLWVIEGVPRDPYYLYGKIQLNIDKENFRGAWNRKFNWEGDSDFLVSYQPEFFNYQTLIRFGK